MPAKNHLLGRVGSGSGFSFPRPSSRSGRPSLTGDPQRDYAALLGYENEAINLPDSSSKDLTDKIVRMVKSPDEDVQAMGRRLMAQNARVLDRNRLADLEVPAPSEEQDKNKGGLWDKVKNTGLKALEVIGRPGQATMEAVQAGADVTGLDELAQKHFTGGRQDEMAVLSSAEEAGVQSEGAQNLLGEGTDRAGYGSSGGFRDVWRALKGDERWDPTAVQQTRGLSYANALGQDLSNLEGMTGLDAVVKAADFTGQAALDPLNLVGGGSGAAARAAQKTAAREIAEGGFRELSPRLAAQLDRAGIAKEALTEDAVYDALRRVGVREGLTSAQKEGLQTALTAEKEAGRAVLKGDADLGVLRPQRLVRNLTAGGELRSGARRAAEQQFDAALRYDRGGLRLAGRSVTPEGLSFRVREALGKNPQNFGRERLAAEVMGEGGAVERRIGVLQNRVDQLTGEANEIPRVMDESGTRWHGTSRAFEGDTLGDPYAAASADNLFGPGFYTTDDLSVAKKYTKKGRGGSPAVYSVSWANDTPPTLFDLDANIVPPDVADEIKSTLSSDYLDAALDDIAEVETAIDSGASAADVYTAYRNALSNAGVPRSQADEIIDALNDSFLSAGYDGFKHRGGQLVGNVEHGVEIYFPERVFDGSVQVSRQADNVSPEAQTLLDQAAETQRQIDALSSARTAEEAVQIDPGLTALMDVRTVSERGRVADALAPAFRTGDKLRRSTRLPEGVDRMVKMAEELGTSTTARQAKRLGQRIQEAAKKVNRQLTPEENEQILRAMGPNGTLDKTQFADELGDYIDAIEDMRQTTYDMLIEHDLVDPAKLQAADEYVPRYFTEEGMAAMETYIRENYDSALVQNELLPAFQQFSEASTVGHQGGRLMRRTLDTDLDLVGFNNKWKNILGVSDDVVEMDPANIFARRFNETQRSAQLMIAVDEMEKNLKGVLGENLVRRVKPGASAEDLARAKATARRQGYVAVPAQEAGTIFVHPDLEEAVTQYSRILDTDESITKFGKLLDNWNRMWKSYATVPVLGGTSFHTKNSIGNMFNNYLAGVTNPGDYVEAMRIQNAMRKARKAHPDLDIVDALRAEGADDRWVNLVDLAEQRGVIDESFFSRDIMDQARDVTERTAKTRRERTLGRLNPADPDALMFVRSGRVVGEAVEDNARLTHFISKMDELGDADLAAESVKKYLFDYGDLTPFEQKYMKRINAFYTFTRKNTPLQFSEIARNPSAINRLSMAEGAALGYGQNDPAAAPEWMGEIGAPTSSGVSALLSGRDDPQVIANFETPFEAAMDMASPLRSLPVVGDRAWQDSAQELAGQFSGGPAEGIKALLVEPATGTSMFTGAPLKDQDGNYRDSPWLKAANAFVPQVSKVANLFNVDDRLGGTSSTDSATLRGFRALTGLTAKELTDEYQDQAVRSEANDIQEQIDALLETEIVDPITGETRAPYVPTISQLQAIEQIARPESLDRRQLQALLQLALAAGQRTS